jgi:hypothetical protein
MPAVICFIYQKNVTGAGMIDIQTTTEKIESKGGLYLAGTIAKKMGLTEIKSGVLPCAAGVITSLFAGMVQGNTGFESAREGRGNGFLSDSFGTGFNYSADTVRLYFGRLADGDRLGTIRQLRETALNLVEKAHLTGIRIRKKTYFPVDVDTSPMDNSRTKKEGVGWTYKKFDGYHPIFAYIGKEGYMLDNELRPGSQHCQNGTPEFLRLLLERLPERLGGLPLLFRLDSGNDSADTIKALFGGAGAKGRHMIMKRNNRREGGEEWLEYAKKHGKANEARPGKTAWTGCAREKHPAGFGKVHCVYEVTERATDEKGNPLLFHDIEVNTWWTDLPYAAETVIGLYHDHGTSEQYHSELKHDMDIERLPSGKFSVNELYLMVGMNAYNALRFIGQSAKAIKEAIPVRSRGLRMRLGKVIQNIIGISVKYVSHAGKKFIKIWEGNPWKNLYIQLDTVFQRL